jgi:alcohol dehydrogenase (cytochrome c)
VYTNQRNCNSAPKQKSLLALKTSTSHTVSIFISASRPEKRPRGRISFGAKLWGDVRSSILFAIVLPCLAFGQTGQRLFETRCAACHGSDAAGGERGPSLVEGRRGAGRFRDTIRNGRPEAGMPAFAFSDSDMNAVLSFLASLTAPAIEKQVSGDAAAGQRFFFGAGNCRSCHMIQGRGGIAGPELSNLGRERRLSQIEQSLTKPGTTHQVLSVELPGGRKVRGIVRNESNFDVQLLGLDGAMHLLEKARILRRVEETKSLMPPVTATPDLLAFLSRLDRNQPLPGLPPLSTATAVKPGPGDWPTYNGQWNGNRHSPLKQIHPGNVAQLAPQWIFTVPDARRLQVTPLVVDGVMYVTAANQAYALDARTGRQIWQFRMPLTKGVIGDASAAINRGAALLGDKVFLITDHAHLLALHRATGALLWDVEVADYRQHYGMTSAPLVVNDLVLVGTSGGDEGAPGFITAHKASTGELVWKHRTLPAPGEPGSETWVGRALEHGCAAPWLTGSYDPEVGLVYWTTGNPCPDYNGDERQGDNLYSSSVIALDPSTGQRRWHYQFTPHDLHDWDASQPVLAVNAVFRGRPRKLLLQANRNGFFYVLDRVTGEFLLGEPFVKKMTWASGIGPDGRPKVLPDTAPTVQGNKVCPAVEGATNWMSSSYSAGTGLFYVMSLESCNIYSKSALWWRQGESFYGGGTRRVPGEKGVKILRALDIQTGKVVWEYPQIGPGNSWGGVLSTDGGLVFFGEDSGAFAAVEAKSGKYLWHFQTSQLWKASPMTYSADGRQFVAVASGGNILAFGVPGK